MADTITNSFNDGGKAVKRGLPSAPPNDSYLQWDTKGVEERQSRE